jgi:hypothetical protein
MAEGLASLSIGWPALSDAAEVTKKPSSECDSPEASRLSSASGAGLKVR